MEKSKRAAYKQAMKAYKRYQWKAKKDQISNAITGFIVFSILAFFFAHGILWFAKMERGDQGLFFGLIFCGIFIGMCLLSVSQSIRNHEGDRNV